MRTYTKEEIGTLLANCTPGEWQYDDFTQNIYADGDFVAEVARQSDAAFIAAAPAIVAQLLAENERMKTALLHIVNESTITPIATRDKDREYARGACDTAAALAEIARFAIATESEARHAS